MPRCHLYLSAILLATAIAATALAADQMERLMVLPYDDPDLDDGNHPISPDQIPIGIDSGFWNVTVNYPDTNMKTIKITVIWEAKFEGVHGQRSVKFDFIRVNI